MATEFQKKVWEVVAAIPEGRVATYGDIARAAGRPNLARYISNIIAQHPQAAKLPWHRFVYSNGKVWMSPENEVARRKAYKKEGIILNGDKIENFADVRYEFE